MDKNLEEIQKEIAELDEPSIRNRVKICETNMRIMKNEKGQISHEIMQLEQDIAENKKKLNNNKRLPYLVSNIVEMLDNTDPETREEHEYHITAIIKTSTRQTVTIHI